MGGWSPAPRSQGRSPIAALEAGPTPGASPDPAGASGKARECCFICTVTLGRNVPGPSAAAHDLGQEAPRAVWTATALGFGLVVAEVTSSSPSTPLAPLLFQATVNARPQRILTASSLTQSAPASPTNKGIHIHQAG